MTGVARCFLTMVVLAGLVCAAGLLANRSRAQSGGDAALGTELEKLSRAGKYGEATEIAKRALAARETALGPEHPDVATALKTLADLYRTQARYSDAEPLYRRSLAIREKALGSDHPGVGAVLNGLAGLYEDQARYSDAEPLYLRCLAIAANAEGPGHPNMGAALNNLGQLYHQWGRLAQAERLYERSLAVTEKTFGPDHPNVARTLNNLAQLYLMQRRFAEAEPLYRRSLAIRERALGLDDPGVGTALNNLAFLFRDQGRYTEAEPLLRRSLAIGERALGPDHPNVARTLNNLAAVYLAQGRYADAEPLFARSLTIMEKVLGPEHPDVAKALGNLVNLYRVEGRYFDAELLCKRALAISENALGRDHLDVGMALTQLARLYRDQARYSDAEPLYLRRLAIAEKALGPEHIDVSDVLNSLARLSYDQSNWARAVSYWQRSTSIIKHRAERGPTIGPSDALRREAERRASQFWNLVRATHRLTGQRPTPGVAGDMFEIAQWGLGSQVAASLAQVAARSAKGSPELSDLVRERQDLVGEWQARDKLLIAAKSQEPAKRNAEVEKSLADRLAAIDVRLTEIDRRLRQDFPDHAAMASPVPLSVAEVQAQLGADEALLLFLDTPELRPLPEEGFIWVVTKSEVRWVHSDLGTAGLTREVVALRCGLDATAWVGEGADRCAKILGLSTPIPKLPYPLPFDHARAHRLYAALFGNVQDLIKGKHLLIVPSGPLAQLPFHALVTRPPLSNDHRAVAWLARDHAVTVLPAVSSLKALRRVGRPSTAPRPMIGFGNPLLDGLPNDTADVTSAKLARKKQRCPVTPRGKVADLANPRGGVARIETRGGLADPAHLKMQAPLHETADELCRVAQDMKADASDIHLGARATEREVKRLSASGELAKYRLVHFATHGLLAGELEGTDEPGLILTPPVTATEEDDGYLSVSEIAALKLDADWVILSACNTAAGASTSAEALSGLARAFIYAQARALLVSHWEVYSDAAVKLITEAVGEMARDDKVGRSEAMRRSMLALIDKGAPEEAHPAFWAPFVVVGEGAAGR
jgi:CHAT domain-containing protein/tetratricopeptide (TPR) repeat protein